MIAREGKMHKLLFSANPFINNTHNTQCVLTPKAYTYKKCPKIVKLPCF